MKKFLAGIFAATLLLTGCGGEDAEQDHHADQADRYLYQTVSSHGRVDKFVDQLAVQDGLHLRMNRLTHPDGGYEEEEEHIDKPDDRGLPETLLFIIHNNVAEVK